MKLITLYRVFSTLDLDLSHDIYPEEEVWFPTLKEAKEAKAYYESIRTDPEYINGNLSRESVVDGGTRLGASYLLNKRKFLVYEHREVLFKFSTGTYEWDECKECYAPTNIHNELCEHCEQREKALQL